MRRRLREEAHWVEAKPRPPWHPARISSPALKEILHCRCLRIAASSRVVEERAHLLVSHRRGGRRHGSEYQIDGHQSGGRLTVTQDQHGLALVLGQINEPGQVSLGLDERGASHVVHYDQFESRRNPPLRKVAISASAGAQEAPCRVAECHGAVSGAPERRGPRATPIALRRIGARRRRRQRAGRVARVHRLHWVRGGGHRVRPRGDAWIHQE